ncbi:LysR substrate-binding domain-containing protein [Sinisalibacter lacisalsi]|uniref:Transcriptional regulator n=1 Tax=Sinisalibacter lacisalsi TaxID=1526570 RepID=A0ABQ1QXV0_9RHOB|nr:LysR substrate-binding domain-containing protein [Sinisalibacter lacisalsi]GGD47597.1 transcriptional regulator [Sinisalibacter lacisalsi]
MTKNLTLTQIRVLEALCRAGGVGAAARDLGVSQPTVSAQLRQIEDRYALRLFQREGHRLIPNAVSHALLPRMRAALALMSEIETTLDRTSTLEAGRLSIGYSTHQFVMPLLSDFITTYPGLRVEARSQATGDLLRLLHAGEVEAVFITISRPDPALHSLELRRERIILMARRDHPLSHGDPLGWDDIARLGLIRREPSSGTRMMFDAAAVAAGARVRHVLDLGSWESMRAAVIAGIGLGVAMEGEIDPDDPQVAAVPIRDPALEVGHYLACLPEMAGLAPVRAFFDLARAHLSKSTPAKL